MPRVVDHVYRRRRYDLRIVPAQPIESRPELLVEDGDLAVEHERGRRRKSGACAKDPGFCHVARDED
jgi:hypothetical protein